MTTTSPLDFVHYYLYDDAFSLYNIIIYCYYGLYSNNAINAGYKYCCWLLLYVWGTHTHMVYAVLEKQCARTMRGRQTQFTHRSHTHTLMHAHKIAGAPLVLAFLHFVRKQFPIFNFWRNFAEIVRVISSSVASIRVLYGEKSLTHTHTHIDRIEFGKNRFGKITADSVQSKMTRPIPATKGEKINFEPVTAGEGDWWARCTVRLYRARSKLFSS